MAKAQSLDASQESALGACERCSGSRMPRVAHAAVSAAHSALPAPKPPSPRGNGIGERYNEPCARASPLALGASLVGAYGLAAVPSHAIRGAGAALCPAPSEPIAASPAFAPAAAPAVAAAAAPEPALASVSTANESLRPSLNAWHAYMPLRASSEQRAAEGEWRRASCWGAWQHAVPQTPVSGCALPP